MKVIFFNTWNANIRDGITEFIKEHCRDTDIFCLQEVFEDNKIIYDNLLPNYQNFFADKYLNKKNAYAQATYVHTEYTVLSSQIMFENLPDSGLGLYTCITRGSKSIHVLNFHGIGHPGDKLDNPGRVAVSKRIIDFFKDKQGPKIIGGDFNILPDTKSIDMFVEKGFRDLIKDFAIPATRNQLAWKQYPETKQYYSDYVFVSPDIKINDFSVPNIEISDHLPLIVDFEL